jgi:hypothetical protein
MVRVVFAEDNYLVREGPRRCSRLDEVELIGTASALRRAHARGRGAQARGRAHRHPDAPVEHDRGHRRGAAHPADHPDIGVVVLSQFAEEATRTSS